MLKGLEKWSIFIACEECDHLTKITNINDKEVKWVLKVLKPRD